MSLWGAVKETAGFVKNMALAGWNVGKVVAKTGLALASVLNPVVAAGVVGTYGIIQSAKQGSLKQGFSTALKNTFEFFDVTKNFGKAWEYTKAAFVGEKTARQVAETLQAQAPSQATQKDTNLDNKALQDLYARVAKLEEENERLKRENEELRAKIAGGAVSDGPTGKAAMGRGEEGEGDKGKEDKEKKVSSREIARRYDNLEEAVSIVVDDIRTNIYDGGPSSGTKKVGGLYYVQPAPAGNQREVEDAIMSYIDALGDMVKIVADAKKYIATGKNTRTDIKDFFEDIFNKKKGNEVRIRAAKIKLESALNNLWKACNTDGDEDAKANIREFIISRHNGLVKEYFEPFDLLIQNKNDIRKNKVASQKETTTSSTNTTTPQRGKNDISFDDRGLPTSDSKPRLSKEAKEYIQDLIDSIDTDEMLSKIMDIETNYANDGGNSIITNAKTAAEAPGVTNKTEIFIKKLIEDAFPGSGLDKAFWDVCNYQIGTRSATGQEAYDFLTIPPFSYGALEEAEKHKTDRVSVGVHAILGQLKESNVDSGTRKVLEQVLLEYKKLSRMPANPSNPDAVYNIILTKGKGVASKNERLNNKILKQLKALKNIIEKDLKSSLKDYLNTGRTHKMEAIKSTIQSYSMWSSMLSEEENDIIVDVLTNIKDVMQDITTLINKQKQEASSVSSVLTP